MKQSAIERLLEDLVWPEGSVYAVGGQVRDEQMELAGRLLGRAGEDLDYLVTGLALPVLIDRLREHGKAELVGAAFGVIKFSQAGTTVDVAIPRREVSTGPHHRDFSVEAAPDIPIEEDLKRRDFTVNMMARDVRTGRLLDPSGGLDDLLGRRLRVVNRRAFVEDPLRILRGCQLAARFDLEPDPFTIEQMKDSAAMLPTVAPERMAYELTKLLERSRRPSVGFELMRNTGALPHVLPELAEGWDVSQNDFHAHTVYYHSLACCDAAPPELILRLAALLHDVGKPRTKDGPRFYRHEQVGEKLARDALTRLRFGSDVVDRVCHLVARHMYVAADDLSDAAVRRFVRRVGPQNLNDLFALRAADIAGSGMPVRDPVSNERFQARVRELLDAPHVLEVRGLAIGGLDVIALIRGEGFAGPDYRGDRRVGKALHYCLEQVLDDPSKNQPDVLRGLVRRYLASTR
ncbi:MAG: HD domain-containing protein [Candidatus Eremiobacteraeota bacterium]|nr:HD domain-containing protein [Candidatus Eremiobacteraeota bacterium]MBC5826339.1 HD domain-containing protein [Candidatus Eremiobacteraeota bacterium]